LYPANEYRTLKFLGMCCKLMLYCLLLKISSVLLLLWLLIFLLTWSLDSFMNTLGSYNNSSSESSGIPLIPINFLKDVFHFLINSFCLVMVYLSWQRLHTWSKVVCKFTRKVLGFRTKVLLCRSVFSFLCSHPLDYLFNDENYWIFINLINIKLLILTYIYL